MFGQLFDFSGMANAVGGIYIFIGITGALCNMVTLLMITCYRMYRLSAYTIMANLALADAIMLIIAGLVCGLNIIQVPFHNYDNAANNSFDPLNNSKSILSPKFSKIFDHTHTNPMINIPILKMDEIQNHSYHINKNQINTLLEDLHFSLFLLSFLEIASWTAGIMSYAFLGINRCIAICFYRTRAKTINRVSFALLGSTVAWIIGIFIAYFGTIPVPLMGMRTDMWTVSFLITAGRRPAVFIVLMSFFNSASILAQWLCSLMVLIKIHKVRQKINCNKLHIGSAKRFKKQVSCFYHNILNIF
ncbi:unnamed protein product [Onchocerca flexuosa]|uniref:7TM_GPCR_Srx domain-containing protein n=1 Tax=Onchocerca flexuosa TaxID=387005 RepID=A0A183HFQ0_9BILA|nr:unnamed protein product [Onchocerca flexuosa]